MAPRCTQDWHALAHACSTTPFALNYTVENQTNIAILCNCNTVFKKMVGMLILRRIRCLSYMFLLQFHLFSPLVGEITVSDCTIPHGPWCFFWCPHFCVETRFLRLTELTPLKSSSKVLYSSNCTSWLMVLHRATHRFLLIDASHHYSTKWHPLVISWFINHGNRYIIYLP